MSAVETPAPGWIISTNLVASALPESAWLIKSFMCAGPSFAETGGFSSAGICRVADCIGGGADRDGRRVVRPAVDCGPKLRKSLDSQPPWYRSAILATFGRYPIPQIAALGEQVCLGHTLVILEISALSEPVQAYLPAAYRCFNNSSTVKPMSFAIWRSRMGETSRPGCTGTLCHGHPGVEAVCAIPFAEFPRSPRHEESTLPRAV